MLHSKDQIMQICDGLGGVTGENLREGFPSCASAVHICLYINNELNYCCYSCYIASAWTTHRIHNSIIAEGRPHR
jgi:hypothetical protein